MSRGRRGYVVGDLDCPGLEAALGDLGLEVERCAGLDEAIERVEPSGDAGAKPLAVIAAPDLVGTHAANEALRELADKKRALAAMVVHDLRNPLTAVQGNVGLLAECLASTDPVVKRALRDLQDLAEHALSLVASLLDVEELEEGLLAAQLEDVDVAELLSRTSRHQRAVIEFRELGLEVDIPAALEARLDPHLVSRVVENLVDNAVRYAPRGGKVRVAALRDGGDLIIEVSNSGPAVPPGERDAIFDRYFRVEQRRQAARANRGLGLYFCKLAAQAHGGRIAATDGTAELPARFELRLPQARS